MKYVQLIIANNSDSTDQFYTYGCRFDDIKVGQKVSVPFTRGNKLKEAYVFEVADDVSEKIKG
jgi:primosomal protein N' (replication factor Y)